MLLKINRIVIYLAYSLNWIQSNENIQNSMITRLFSLKLPLVLIGTLLGSQQRSKLTLDNSETREPRKIPEQLFRNNPWPWTLLCGLSPLSCFFGQLFQMMNMWWKGDDSFFAINVDHLSTDVCLFMLFCFSQSISISYSQLRCEDYRWWWRQFLVCGFTAIFFILFATLFYVNQLPNEQIDRLTCLVYFGHICLASFLLFMLAGKEKKKRQLHLIFLFKISTTKN